MKPEAHIADVLAPWSGARLGVAVSGGGDSIAMLHLAVRWGNALEIRVATVDHGLRPEAADEALFVSKACEELRISHQTLAWHAPERGNLQSNARQARRALLADWAHENGLDAVLLGHTQDDVVETFLMRLSRGSGVDGLAAMRPQLDVQGMTFVRPILGLERAVLREWLQAHGLGWCEDPSNMDNRFQRARTRKALETIGIDTRRLAQTAIRLREASDVVAQQVERLGRAAICHDPDGSVRILRDAYASGLQAVRYGLLSRLMRAVSGQTYAPRADALDLLDKLVLAGAGSSTLAGWLLAARPDFSRLTREPARLPTAKDYAAGVWDRRWVLSGLAPDTEGELTLAPLGESGLSQRDWRASGYARAALLSTPALFDGERLLVSPVLDADPAVSATLKPLWPLVSAR